MKIWRDMAYVILYMRGESKYQSRLNEYRKEIRRAQLDKIKRDLRRAADTDYGSLEELALVMRLEPGRARSIQEIIAMRSHELANPPLKSGIEDEKDLPIQAHIRFWKFYSEMLQEDKSAWMQQVSDIMLSIIHEYTYQAIHYNIVYQLHFLNTLERICLQGDEKTKEEVLEWIAGPEGLRVIEVCVGKDEFLNCKIYHKVYRVIELGLKSQMRQENEDAAAVLTKIVRNADWDDNYQIYTCFHGLMIFLCNIIERYYKNGTTRVYSEAVTLLLDAYEETVLDYARTGAAYSAALLISSPHQASRLEGITILQVLSQVSDRSMLALLLENRDITSTRLWENLFKTVDFSRSGNTKLRELFYSFLENIFAHADFDQTGELSLKFGGPYDDVFDLLAECMREQENGSILISGMNTLKSISFYGQSREENQLLPILQKKEIVRYLHQLAEREEEPVNQLACEMLSNLKVY